MSTFPSAGAATVAKGSDRNRRFAEGDSLARWSPVRGEGLEWIEQLDDATHARVVQAIDALAEVGPGLGRPLVDTIAGSKIQNRKTGTTAI